MSQFTVERVPLTEVCEFDESSPIDDRIVAESMLLALIPGEHPLRNRSYNVLATNFKKHLSGPSRCTNQRGGIAKMGVNLVVYRKIVVVAGIIDTGSAGGEATGQKTQCFKGRKGRHKSACDKTVSAFQALFP